jgi:putative ABC transport system permease protein
LIEGEIFDDLLSPDEAVPVVVNQAFVDAYFPGATPVGRRVAFDRTPTENSYWYPIVGVVGNERMLHASAPRPEIISQFGGDTPGTMSFAIKTELPPQTLTETVRDTVADVDARIPFVAPRTMNEVAADALVRERFLMTLLGVFAVAALILAAVGVYGVAAQGAKVRTKEIGIRMALGATGDVIARQLVLRAAVFIGAGLLLGLAVAAAGGRLIAGFLYGIEPFDPATWLGVALLLAAVGLFASYLPARVAARTDPSRALYTE